MSSTTRQSNFELLRLVCMVMVMIAHANFGVFGETVRADVLSEPLVSFGHISVNQLVIASLNVFIMISGWFGIRPSCKGFCSLMFQVVFLSLLSVLICLLAGWEIPLDGVVLPLFFGSGYWFVACYVILYILSPVLNAYVENADRKSFRTLLILFFTAEMIFGWLYDSAYFIKGFSPLSFIGLYLLMRYLRIYPSRLLELPAWANLLLYFGISILSAVVFFVGLKWFDLGFHLIQYNSPTIILASLFLFLTFYRLSFKSRVINWMAASAFAIYLLHENPLLRAHYRGLIRTIFDCFTALPAIGISLCAILIIAFVCILADRPRIWLWNLINGRFQSR